MIDWITSNQAFQESDFDVEIAFFLAVELLPDRCFLWHMIAAAFVSGSSLEVKRTTLENATT